MSVWRPIASAPRDGTRVLLYDKVKDIAVSGSWHSDPGTDTPLAYEPPWSWWVSDNDVVMWGDGPDDHPTHWMPMPEPPRESRNA